MTEISKIHKISFDLQSLAKFHALGIAIRCLQPKVFETKISPYLKPVNSVLNNAQIVDVNTNMLRHIFYANHFFFILQFKNRVSAMS